jgi:uncharacterized protein
MKKPQVDSMRNLAQLVVLQLLRAYKWAISPLLPPSCRYVPTCSEYAMEAVDRFGVLRGGWMACTRILRCHPFVRGGYDPVIAPKFGWWKRAASSPHHAPQLLTGFSSCDCPAQHLERNH